MPGSSPRPPTSRSPTSPARTPRRYRIQKWVADKLTEASVNDPAVNTQYTGVVNMQLPPKALTNPRFLTQAARILLSS
ncbi:hypothetical protein [Streptomyces vietnamensis]|uniref:hypothetical protein n=1 Tax=Streptomyces vietnamensis TaxID=362257 RepID=UPI00341BCED3